MAKPKLNVSNEDLSIRSIAAIKKSARRLFGTKGYYNVSLEVVLKSARLTKGSFYHHFNSKKDLFETIFFDAFEEMIELSSDANSELSPINRLFADFKAFVDFTIENKLIQILVVDAPSVFGSKKWAQINEEFYIPSTKRYFEELSKEGLLDKKYIEPLAVMVLGANHESMRRYIYLGTPEKIHSQIRYTKMLIEPFLQHKQ